MTEIVQTITTLDKLSPLREGLERNSSLEEVIPDEKVNKEIDGLTKKRLETDAIKDEYGRGEKIRNSLNYWMLKLIMIVSLAIGITFLIWFYHLIIPKFGWLDNDAIIKIEGMGKFIVGIIAGFLASYIKTNKS